MHLSSESTNVSVVFEILAYNIKISLHCWKNLKTFFAFKFFDLLRETNLFLLWPHQLTSRQNVWMSFEVCLLLINFKTMAISLEGWYKGNTFYTYDNIYKPKHYMHRHFTSVVSQKQRGKAAKLDQSLYVI